MRGLPALKLALSPSQSRRKPQVTTQIARAAMPTLTQRATLPLVYRDTFDHRRCAREGSVEAPRRLGKNARFSLKIAMIVRSHARESTHSSLAELDARRRACGARQNSNATAFNSRTPITLAKATRAQSALGRADGEQSALSPEQTFRRFRSLKAVPRAYLNAALEVSDMALKAAPLDRARFGRIIGLTQAERVECRAYQVRPCDMSMKQARAKTYRRSQAKRRVNMSDEQREAGKKRNAERKAAKRQAKRQTLAAATLAVLALWLRRLETLSVDRPVVEKYRSVDGHSGEGRGRMIALASFSKGLACHRGPDPAVLAALLALVLRRAA